EYGGNFQLVGEPVSLIKPGEPPVPVDRGRYQNNAPWPALVAGTSFQLVDAMQASSRVGNLTNRPARPTATDSIGINCPAFPQLWLNELQAENLTGPTDNVGERDPWVEIYNAGGTTQSLAGLYLGTNGAPTQWAFPSNVGIGPGQMLIVWLDGQAGQSAGSILH